MSGRRPRPRTTALRAALLVAAATTCAAARAAMPDGSIVSLDVARRLCCEIRGRVGQGVWQHVLQPTALSAVAQPLSIDWGLNGGGPVELRHLSIDCRVAATLQAPARRYMRALVPLSEFWIMADGERRYPDPRHPLRLRIQPLGSVIADGDDDIGDSSPAIWGQLGDRDPFSGAWDLASNLGGRVSFYTRVVTLLPPASGHVPLGSAPSPFQPGGDAD